MTVPSVQAMLSDMNRTISYSITESDNARKIQHFLRRRGYSRQNLIELKKTEGSVTVNQQPRHFNERVYAGDILCIHITETEISDVLPVSLPVGILYEDEDLLIVDKPAGMPTHPSFKNTDNTLANALAWYYQEKGVPFVFRCSNRLDRDTSGLTIISKHFVSAAILSDMGTRHEILREYLAIVRGTFQNSEGTIDAPLGRTDGSIIERCVDYEHGEKAVTHYRVIASFRYDGPLQGAHQGPERSADLPGGKACTLSLVSLRLETGRTHQIRVHMQSVGHPLIGDYLYDPQYGSESVPLIGRQALHAHRLRFTHPITGQLLEFTSPLPHDMKQVLDRCSGLP